MAKDKALGLEDFSMTFFQICWDIVRKVFGRFFVNFTLKRDLSKKKKKKTDTTFIALILKRVGVFEVKDYQLINLVNWVFKVFANYMSFIMEMII